MDEFGTSQLCIFLLAYVWIEMHVGIYGLASHGWIET